MLRKSLVSSILFASLAFVSGSALADPATFSSWMGSYTSAAPDQAKDTIEQAIEKGTSSMGALRRSVARSRLKNTNRAYQVVRISPSGDELVTTFDGRSYEAPTDGGAKKGKDPDGKSVTVSYKAEGDTLKSRFIGEDGEKRIDFERTPDGQGLIMHVTVISKKLPAPIKYSVRYHKK
jgi:hypothetical protein